MAGKHRARADQAARRVNAAAELLASGCDVAEASRQLARRHRISGRQARRYVERARDSGPVEVPSAKIVFTVKLPTDLVRRVRQQARRSGQTISSVVALALKEFLDRLGAGARDGR
jgi:DNA-binding transcriptional regulator LsrR (DeoR family)